MEHGSKHRVFPEAQSVENPYLQANQLKQSLRKTESKEPAGADQTHEIEGYCYRFRASRRLFCNNKLISLFASIFRIRKLIFSKEGRRNKYFRSGYLRLESLDGIPDPTVAGELAPPFCTILMGNEVVFDPVTRDEGRKLENINQKEVHLQEVPLQLFEPIIRKYFSQFGRIMRVTLWPLQSDSPSRSVIVEFESPEAASSVETCRIHWIDGHKVVAAKKSSTKLIEYSGNLPQALDDGDNYLQVIMDESDEQDQDDGSDDLEVDTQIYHSNAGPNSFRTTTFKRTPLYSPSSQQKYTPQASRPVEQFRIKGQEMGSGQPDLPSQKLVGDAQFFGLPSRRIVLPYPSNTKVLLEELRERDFQLCKLSLSSISLPTKIVSVDEKNSSSSILSENYTFNLCRSTARERQVLPNQQVSRNQTAGL